MPYAPRRPASAALPPAKESSAQAASAARIRRTAPPWLVLATTRGLDEDTAHRQRISEIRGGLPFLDPDAGVPRAREPAEFAGDALRPLDDWLAKRATAVSAKPAELTLAKGRAEAVSAALKVIYPKGKQYRTGSIAHGDALSPLNDVDLGVVLPNRSDLGRGPGQNRPEAEMRWAAERLTALLRPQFRKLTADPGGKRSIVLNFNQPATPGAPDFTCDVIIALPGTAGSLLIPNTDIPEGWDENDPIGHVELLKEAEQKSDESFSRTVRLVKHWRDGQGAKPLYSWNIKTLALEAGADSTRPFDGLYRFFAHAVHSVAEGPTENPGSASFPPPTVPIDRHEVTRQLLDAVRTLDRARMFALANRPAEAVATLSGLFPQRDPG